MSAVVKAVKSVVKGAVNLVKSVVKTVGDVVKAALDDPITTIAKVAAYATGNAWAIPLIDGASVAAKGGDIGDVVRAAAISYGTGKVASAVGTPVGKAAGQFAAQQGATEATQKLVTNILTGATGRATVAIVTKQDPVQAFITGGAMAAAPAVLGKIDGFNEQPQWVQNTLATTVGATIATGGNLTERDVASIVAASGIVGRALEQFDPDGTKLTAGQRAVAADALFRTTSAALVGGDPGEALTRSLTNSALKALGEYAKEGLHTVTNAVSEAYARATGTGDKLDSLVAKAQGATDQYNSVRDSLDAAVKEQERLEAAMNAAIKRHNDASDDTHLAAANSAVKAYEDYVTSLNKAYNEYYKPELDRLSKDLTTFDTQYKELTGVLRKDQDKLQAEIDKLTTQLDPVYANSNRAFAEGLLPGFDAAAYRALNPDIPADVDPYLHYISEGQFQGLRATKDQLTESQNILSAILDNPNVDERALQAYIDAGLISEQFVTNTTNRSFDDVMAELNARVTTEEEAQQFFREAFGREATSAADLALIQQYTGQSEADAQALLNPVKTATQSAEERRRQNLASTQAELEDILRSEGFTDADIASMYQDRSFDAFMGDLLAAQDRNIQALESRVAAASAMHGPDSQQAKDALREMLQAKYDAGAYDIDKVGDEFVVTGALGSRDNPLQHAGLVIDADGNVTDLTGQRGVEIDMLFPTGEQYTFGPDGEQAIAGLLAIGESPTPPADGGRSLFGDGSGASGGRIPGFTFAGIDNKTGGYIFDSEFSGFALLLYSDGKALAVNKVDPTQVVWVDTEVAKEVITPEPPKTAEQVREEFKDAERQKADESMVTADEVRKAFDSLGYQEPTDDVIASFTGGTPSQAQVMEAIDRYVDENTVTQDEARAYLESIGVKNPTQADVDRFVGQYAQAELETRVQPYVPDIKYNALSGRISELDSLFDARVAELVAQGQNEFEASQNALKDINNLIGVQAGEGTDPTGLYGDIAGLPSELADRIGGLGTALEGQLEGLGGKVGAARGRRVQYLQGRTQNLVGGLMPMLPFLAQDAFTTGAAQTTPLYSESQYVDLSAPLQIGPAQRHSMFDPARQNQQGPTKMASGGFLNDQGDPDTWDDILRMLGK